MVIFETNTNRKAYLMYNMKRMKSGLKTRLRIFILTIIGLTGNIALAQSVTISSISPNAAVPGDTITITGTGFTTAANGYLDLSSAEANIIASTTTQVQFTVPGNAIPGPVLYTNLTTNFTVQSSQILNILGDTDSSYVFSPPCDLTGNTNSSVGVGDYVDALSKLGNDVYASGTFSDFDKDGDLDFIHIQESTSLTGSALYIWKNNNTTNAFSTANLARVEKQVVEQAENVSIFDANADGKQDLIVTNGNSGAGGANTVSILLNDYTTSTYIFSTTFDLSLPHLDMVQTADMTDDGLQDIIGLRDDMDTVVIYKNTTTVGAFTNFSINQNDSIKLGITNSTGGDVTPYHIELGDFNLDGRQDIVVAHSEGLQIFMRDASSTWSSIHITSTVAYGFIAVGDLNSDGKSDIVVSPVSKTTSQSIYGYLNTYTSGTLAASDFGNLTIPHATNSGTNSSYVSTARNYHFSLADVNWDGKMDIISAALGGSSRASHWVIENRAADMQSLSGSDFGTPIRININKYALPGNYPYYRHTFAADFNKDSVPDLVSFHRQGIEFQTNTVAREPGVLEVTQLKSLDDTVQCNNSDSGDTLLFEIYVKGLKANQENADLFIELPKYYRFKVTYDRSPPPTAWSSIYDYNTNWDIATPSTIQDTLFLWLRPGNLADVSSSLLNSTRTETDSVQIFFVKKNNNSLACRKPEPVWTAPFTNTWLGRPAEVFSVPSNYHRSHTISCGHGDSLEFKFTSPESDTLLYQVWYRNNTSSFPNNYISNPSTRFNNADTISGYYDIAVASGDTFRAPYDSLAGGGGPYTAYKALVTDENGCTNYTSSSGLWHRYYDNNTIQSVTPSSVNAGDAMRISPVYWGWHRYGPGNAYDDSITLNDINVGPYIDLNSRLDITVPALPIDTVLGYNDTIKLYYHNPNPTEQCVSSFVFEYRNTLVSGDSLSVAEMQWHDLLKGSMWDPYDDQTGTSSEIDLVGNDSNALFQATYQRLYDTEESKLTDHLFFRARLGDSTFNDGLLWIGLDIAQQDMEVDTYLRVDLANYTISLHDTIQTSSTFNNTPNQLNINPSASGTLTGTNNYYISLYNAATDLDQNGQEDSWLEIGFDLAEFNRFKSLNMIDQSAISVFTSDTAQNNYDYAGFDDGSELDSTWQAVGALTIGTIDEFTSGKTLAPYDIFNSNQLKDYSSDTMYVEGVWGGHMGADEDTIYFTWNNQEYTIDSSNVVIDQHKWRFYIYDWQVDCQFANGETRSLSIYTKGESDASYRSHAVSISKYAGTGSLQDASTGATDNFETGTLPNPDLWDSFGVAANIYGNNTSPCGDAIEGFFALHFYGYGNARWIQTVPLDLSNGGDIKFWVAQGTCEAADGGEGVRLSYSLNGGQNWVDFRNYSSYPQNPPNQGGRGGAAVQRIITIPTAAQTSSTMIRFRQNQSGTNYDELVLDDFEFPLALDSLVSLDTLITYENAASEFVDFSVPFRNAQSSPFSVLSVDSAFISGQDSLDVTYLSGLPVQLLAGQDVDVHFRFQPRHDTSRLRRDFILNILSDGKDFQNICNSDSVTSINMYGYARALLDTIPPNIAVQPITLPLDSLGGAILYIEDVNVGTSDSNLFTMSLADTTFNCDDLGLNKIVFTAVDENGNTAYDTVYVTVVDNIAPWGVASDVTLYLDSSGTVPFDTAQVYQAFNDNCDATFNFTPQVFTCGDVGAHLSAVSGADEAGNITAVDFIINVKDSLSPWIALFTDTVALNASGQGSLDTSAVIEYIRDNCGIQTIVFSDLDFSASNLGLNTITVSVTDVNNNQSVALTDIWVIDPLAPNVKAKDLVLPLDASGLGDITVFQVDNGSTDNIGFDTLYIDTSSYDCSDLGDHWVVLTGVDKSGNSDTAWSKVTVVDNMDPDVDVFNATIYLDSAGSAALSFQDVDNGSTDNCGIDTTYLSKEVFGCSDIGTYSVLAYAQDSSGNRGSSVLLVTVADTTAPSVAVFSDTVELGTTGVGNLDTTAVLDYIRENCSINSIGFSQLSYTVSDLGQNTLTVTVKDVHSNTTVVTTDIWVVDLIDPNVKANDVILPLNASGTATLTLAHVDDNSSDNAGLDSLYIDASGYDCSDLGDHWVVLTGVDKSGNSDTAWSKVTVVDNMDPDVDVFNATIYLDSAGSAALSFQDVDNGSTDNCGIDTTYLSKDIFGCSDIGTYSVLAYAQDSSGNRGSSVLLVTVADTTAPSVAVFSDTVELGTTGVGNLDTTAVLDYIRENCSINSIGFSQLSYTVSDLGQNTLTVTVKDVHSNTTVVTTDIWVVDLIDPNVKANDVILPLNASGTATLTLAHVDDNSSDNAGLDSLYIDASGYDCSDLGDHWVVLTGVDKSGNSDTAWSKVTVVDQIYPTMSISNATLYLDSSSSAALSYADVDNGTYDNCGIDTTYLSKELFTCSDLGSNPIIATAVDSSGNVSTQIVQVIVLDTLAPSFSLSVDTIQLYTTTSCQGVGSWTYAVGDNCSGVSVTSNYNTGSTFGVGTTKVLSSATDQSGNSTSDSLFVVVTDTLAPFWVNYPFVTQTIPSLTTCGSNISWYPPTAIDYCGLVTITSNYNSGDFFSGPDTVVFTATDLSGNVITYSLPITISDVIAPVIGAISDTTVYVDSNSCFASYTYPHVQVSDNCGIDTTYFVPATGQMSVGTNTVTLYAMDLYGNVSTESYQVTVVDNIPPTLVSGPNDTILGSCNSIFSFPSPVFTDNCGVQTVSLITGGSSGNQFATGTTVNTYVAYDAHGNTDTFFFKITVLPSTAAVLPSYGFVCDTDPDFDLTGGDTNFVFYGGSYIQNNLFSPTASGPGLHNINYSYQDSTGCTTYGNFAMSVSVGPATPVIIRVTSTHLSTHQPYTSYQWFFNGNPIAGATSQTYQATVGGIYKVKVLNDGGCENISAPYFAGVVSTPEYTVHDLEIYPNPTTTDLVIDRRGYAMELDVELYGLTGKQLMESHYEGSEPIRLDMRDYPAGVYLLKLRTAEGVVRNQRIIVQH